MDIFIHIHVDEPLTVVQREAYPLTAVGVLRAALGSGVAIQPYEANTVGRA